MAKKLKDSDVRREIRLQRLGKPYHFVLQQRDVKTLKPADQQAFEDGFAERTRDFNQGKMNSTIEVPSKPQAFWKGYEFARQQEQ